MKKRLYLFLFYLILASGSAPNAFAKSDCESYLFDAEFLSSAQAAIADDYRMEIFAKDVEGGRKFLFLMGESHIKTPASAEIGRDVIRHFGFIGYEGYEAKKTWGGKFSSRVVHPIISALNLKRPGQFAFRRALYRWTGGRSEGSTIADAADAASDVNLKVAFHVLSDEELQEIAARMRTDRDADSEILQTVEEILVARKEGVAPKGLIQEMIHLEQGHEPDIYENLHSIDGYIFWSGMAGLFLAPDSCQPFLSVGMALYCGNGLAGHFFKNTKYSRYFPMERAVVTGRDATMVRNIDETLERPEIHELLAIVGKAHVAGMKTLLLEAGYQSILLPPAESDDDPVQP